VITIEPGGFKTNLTQQAAMETMVRQAHKRASQEQQSFYGGHIAQYGITFGLKQHSTL